MTRTARRWARRRTGTRSRCRRGEVITVTLKTPRTPHMNRNKVGFTHAHGTIKQTVVPKLDAPKT